MMEAKEVSDTCFDITVPVRASEPSSLLDCFPVVLWGRESPTSEESSSSIMFAAFLVSSEIMFISSCFSVLLVQARFVNSTAIATTLLASFIICESNASQSISISAFSK